MKERNVCVGALGCLGVNIFISYTNILHKTRLCVYSCKLYDLLVHFTGTRDMIGAWMVDAHTCLHDFLSICRSFHCSV